MAVVNVWLAMARSQFQVGDLDAALDSIDRALQVESTADAWALKEQILTEKATRGARAIVQPMEVAEGGDRVVKSLIDWKAELAEKLFNSGLQKARQGDMLGASQDWEKVIEINPHDHEAYAGRGDALSELGRYEEAVESYDKAIQIKVNYPEVWNHRGYLLFKLGRHQESIASYKKMIEINLGDHEVFTSLGIILSESSRHEEAVASFNQAIEINPSAYPAWYCRGVPLNALGRYEEAVISFDRAIEIKSDDHAIWVSRGISLDALGRYEEAIGSYKEAIKLNPNDYLAWFNYGNLLNNSGRHKEAIAHYDRAIKINPDEQEAWLNRGNSLSDVGGKEEAIESYEKAIELNPDNHKAWSNCGILLKELGRHKESIASFDKALEIKPDLYEAWYGRSVSLSDLGRNEEAITSFDEALEIKSDLYKAWYARGVSLSDLGRNEEAITSFDKALEIKPDLYEAWYARGVSLSDLGRNEEAITSFDKALEIKPDLYEAWYARGTSMLLLGRNEKAITSLDKVIEFKSDYHKAWNNRGNSLNGLGRYEEALVSCDKAIEFKPDSHQAWVTRSVAVANSRSSKPYALPFIFNQRLANLHLKYPELRQRGYDGQVASLTVGLIHCPADSHALGHGILQRSLGDAHWKYADRTFPRTKWREALTCYEASEKVLTIADHPEERLQTLQRLVRCHFALGTPDETLTALLRQGRELRDRILTQAKSQPQRDRLHRTLPNFNEFTVDLHLRQGETIRAIETAEADKNGLLQWLLPSPETPTYPQMQDWIGDRTVVYWHFSAIALTTFILNADQDQPIVLHPTNPETALKQRNELENWIENWNKTYNNHLETSKNKTDNAENVRSDWQTNLETELEKLATLLDIPTLTTHLNPSKPLILIPHRDLHRLPLPSFFPDFLTTTLPSIQLGRNLRSPHHPITHPPQHLLNIPTPSHQNTNPLPHAALESTLLTQLFQTQTLPVQTIDRCTLPQLQTALPNHHTHLHFNGHAYYNDQNPKQSALALQDTDRLTVENLRSIDLQHYRLITLASCETALTGNQTITAEYVGLVSAFLSHRIPHILSTLWTIQSNASALLILQFYRQLLKGNPPAQSLRHSQRWLQTLTNRKLDRLYRTVLHHITSKTTPTSAESRIEAFLDQECMDLGTMEPNQKPYQDPYFWAAFILAGRH